jgi:hypothetical protein
VPLLVPPFGLSLSKPSVPLRQVTARTRALPQAQGEREWGAGKLP